MPSTENSSQNTESLTRISAQHEHDCVESSGDEVVSRIFFRAHDAFELTVLYRDVFPVTKYDHLYVQDSATAGSWQKNKARNKGRQFEQNVGSEVVESFLSS